ncbi:MAG TPA: polyketide synthase, partial [Acidobacteriota bacterium]|nr:polyketide synthase [Acidobacteriota bacterium]
MNPEAIAIIGMACRFPGQADTPQRYWRLLREGVDAVGEIPPGRWDVEAYYDPAPAKPGSMSTRWGGFIERPEDFDAAFFSISPREAASMDPQQRLVLEVAWEALEGAGQTLENLRGSDTGVFIGIGGSDYAQLHRPLENPSAINPYFGSGTCPSFAAGRLSYFLGLEGPSLAVNTACSSSLVAVHQACQSLRSAESGLALAGGVNLVLSPVGGIYVSQVRAVSPQGRCKVFDQSADGYVRAEGCGIVVLKKLSQARADGDRVLAVIRGSAVNHDGNSANLTAPNGRAQQALLRRALANGGVKPHEVDFVEAHGTGTSLGDPIEAGALLSVLGRERPSDHPLLLGSVKANLGHLEGAAGIAGLIKTVLCLQHAEIPPQLNFKEPNSHIAWDKGALSVPTQPTPWPRNGHNRRAGVSSFGFSGTNAHVVLEEAPKPDRRQGAPRDQGQKQPAALLLPLSARCPEALRQL